MFTPILQYSGNNRFGQCGIGNRDAFVWEPTCLSGIEDIIVDVALGFQHGLALTNKGEVFAWGKGERGQLGKRSIPILVVPDM